MAQEPRLNDRFPIGESLSPPLVDPVNDCAEAVYVHGFVPHAEVEVWAGITEPLGGDHPPFGFGLIALKRRVKAGESITATQRVGAIKSNHSIVPAIVGPLPETAVKTTKPDVGDDLFECGVIVPVGNLVPGGVRVHVTERDPSPGGTTDLVGDQPAAQNWLGVWTKPLHGGRFVSARQVACQGTDHEIVSPPADEVQVKTAPVPTPTPNPPDPYSLIPGNDAVSISGLFVGAGIQIFDTGKNVCSGWFANGSANTFPVDPPLTGGPVTAIQQLCGPPSKESPPVTPKGTLTALTVLEPICAGARFVMIRGSIINAAIVILRNGSPVGHGGAGLGDVPVALGDNYVLNANDIVTAVQYLGPLPSPPSNNAHVVSGLQQPVIEVLGGEPFFFARAGEQAIEGAVFSRGRGSGPVIRVQGCCSKGVSITILGPDGKAVATPQLTEIVPGYFTAVWPWASFSNWAIPAGIPVGRYTVVARTDCQREEARATFFVIFNPADVGGPPRFSFDDTAVWFAAGSNQLHGLHYFLHQSDRRIFTIAINAANGMVDSYPAAVAVARAEEALFGWTITSGTQDTLDQLLNRPEAQCADDACMLVSLLRAIGIPAHPVTADAAAETGAANWGFDTWLEFLASHNGPPSWWVLHPHEYPGMSPETRGAFGVRGVANKGFNDIIVMANESWPFGSLDDGGADVSYSRQSCGEPNQFVSKGSWIDELCEQGYWAQSHWDCAGIQPRSLTAGNGFRIEGEASFGGSLTGTVHLVNPAEERLFGRLVLDLVSVRPGVMALSEQTFGEFVLPSVALDPREGITVPFHFRLPDTLAPGRELVIRARLDERLAARHRLNMAPRVAVKVDAPRSYIEGERAAIRATLASECADVLRDVVAELAAPFAIDIGDGSCRRIGELRPYESRQVEWTVRALSALRAGNVEVAVSTANGGGVLRRWPFEILGRPRPVQARPGFRPKGRRP